MLNTLMRRAGHPARTADAECDMSCRCLVLEDLENRTFLSAAAALAAPSVPAAASPAINVPIVGATTVLPLTITGVTERAGQLFAQGTLGDNSFEVPLTLSAEENPEDEDCPILNLEIGAISLDLLGLQVDTSDICLRITAEPGPGNLLGNLLCDVANLLNDGTPLGDVLGGLTGGQLTTLTDTITQLLNGALGQITAPENVSGVSSSGTSQGNQGNGQGQGRAGVTDILNLSLGPVDLNLLGLDVELDDCEGGPVTVDITAQGGRGNLLGNLLRGLSGLLDGNASDVAVGRLVDRIAGVIGRLLG